VSATMDCSHRMVVGALLYLFFFLLKLVIYHLHVESRHLSDETGSLTTTKRQRQTTKFKKEAILRLQKGILRRAVFYRNSSRNNRSLGADRQRVIHLGRSTPAHQQREGYVFQVFLIDSTDLPHCIFGFGFGCDPVVLDFVGTAIGRCE
jgi:hypothetical protein